MNIANLRSPFILLLSRRALTADAAHPLYVRCSPAFGRFIVSANGQGHRSRGGRPGTAGPAPHGEVAGAHLRHDAALRSGPLDVPLLRPGRARDDVALGRAPEAAAPVLLEVEQVAARLRAPRRQPARLLGAERLSHERRPVDRGALLGPGDARDAAAARRGGPPAPRAVTAA